MARLFNGTTDAAQSASTLDLTGVSQLSVAFWAYVDASSDTDRVVLETSVNYIVNAGCWTFFYNNASNPGKAVVAYFGTGLSYCLITRPSAAAWHHYVLLFDPNTALLNNCTVYVDGAIPGSITYGNLVNAGNMANQKLNVFARNAGASLPEAGRIAELGLWPGLLLGANDIAALYAAYRPTKVRPDKLGWYYPCRYPGASAEPELIKANALTLVNTTSTDHPRIIY